MTVREMMEFLAQQDPDAMVVPCDWGDEMAVRVFEGRRFHELRWSSVEED